MKIGVISILVVVCICYMFGCPEKHTDWQTVYFIDCGTMKIPPEWQMISEEGRIYILNQEGNPVLIQYHGTGEPETCRYFSDMKYVDFITSAGLSNSAIYGREIYLCGNQKKEYLYVDLLGDSSIHFIVWDENLSQKELIDIASTFDVE